MTTSIIVAYGDGVGPEIMEAALHILREAGADLTVETIEIGKRIYAMESPHGILPSAVSMLRQAPVLLKAPTLPPEGAAEDVTAVICKVFGVDPADRTIREEGNIAAATYIGENFAMFEPVQDANSGKAGKNKADPSAAILASVSMLEYIGQLEVAGRVLEAWRETIGAGIRSKKTGTREFADEVANRLKMAKYENDTAA